MKIIFRSFLQMMRAICHDMMLFAVCLGPVLCGILFKFGIPLLEYFLCTQLQKKEFLAPYYGLLDIFFAMLASVLFCYTAAMVVLEENDDKVIRYLFVTRLGKKGYLISRFGIPSGIAFVFTLVLLTFFSLTKPGIAERLLLGLSGACMGLIVALIVVVFSTNKLEGMAMIKLSTVIMLGGVAPYFVEHPVKYLLAPLPSFWMGKGMLEGSLWSFGISLMVSIVWIVALFIKFQKKIAKIVERIRIHPGKIN